MAQATSQVANRAAGSSANGGGGAASVMAALRGTNFAQVESNVFRILPTDIEYEFVIKDATAAEAKESKNPMINLKLQVIWPMEFAGATVYDQCVLTEKSLWKAKGLFEAVGLLAADGSYAGKTLADLKDYAVRAGIRHDEYNGQTRNKIAGGYMEAYEHPDLRQTTAASGAPGAAPTPAPLVLTPPQGTPSGASDAEAPNGDVPIPDWEKQPTA